MQQSAADRPSGDDAEAVELDMVAGESVPGA
jgi:hypothetical protein